MAREWWGTVGDGQKILGGGKNFFEGGQNLTCVIIKHVDLVCVIFAMNTFGIHLTRVNTFRIHPVSVINSSGVNPVSVITVTSSILYIYIYIYMLKHFRGESCKCFNRYRSRTDTDVLQLHHNHQQNFFSGTLSRLFQMVNFSLQIKLKAVWEITVILLSPKYALMINTFFSMWS